MLTLVEPCIIVDLVDRPHLGCAMLIAACQEKGIKIILVNGQTRYLRDMFINDSEELFGLIQNLKDDDLKKIRISSYKKSIREKGVKQFQAELKNMYQYSIIKKDPRHYFNGEMLTKFNNLHDIFVKVYSYYLKEKRGTLKIIDRYIYEILKSNPRYIGFSLQEGVSLSLLRIVRKRIKELTGIPIIIGGSFTPFMDFKGLEKIFDEEYFDYLVVGPGEDALPRLIEALNSKKEPRAIPNVFYKKNGKIIGNNLEVINNLDKLPYPDYSQFNLDLYLTPKVILPLQTARGCTWGKCAFCSHSLINFGGQRTFSIEKVAEIIKYLKDNYNCSHFVFHDEELPPWRAKKVSRAILNNGLKGISIFSYARLINGYNNNELLTYIRKAGFSTFAWGMESGCQRILDLMNKGTNISTMSQILEKSSKNNIANICFIFFGFPGETKEEAEQTIDFLKKHAEYIDDIVPAHFALDPCSPIGKNPQEWDVEVKRDGAYLTKSGMGYKESDVFTAKFISSELIVNNIKITSGKLKYLLPGFNRRLLHFLNSSHRLLSSTIVLEKLRRGEINTISPIILGEVKKKVYKIIFYPINIKETTFINLYFPRKEKTLGRLEEKIFTLSNGTLSIKDIFLAIYEDFKKIHGKRYVYKKCIDFFQDIFLKDWALGFGKSWK